MANTIAINSKLDGFGMFVSCICAVHCLAMPVAFGVLPVIGASFLVGDDGESASLISLYDRDREFVSGLHFASSSGSADRDLWHRSFVDISGPIWCRPTITI